MKIFRCGDVVPGCTAVFSAPDDGGILAQVEVHARRDHAMNQVSAELAQQVRDAITAPA